MPLFLLANHPSQIPGSLLVKGANKRVYSCIFEYINSFRGFVIRTLLSSFSVEFLCAHFCRNREENKTPHLCSLTTPSRCGFTPTNTKRVVNLGSNGYRGTSVHLHVESQTFLRSLKSLWSISTNGKDCWKLPNQRATSPSFLIGEVGLPPTKPFHTAPSLQMLFGFVKSQPMCIHLQFQNLFANLAGYWRTVPQGLIAFSPITPSISATTCGSGGKLASVRLLIDELTHVVRNQASGNRYNLRSLSSCSGCSTGSWWLHWFCCIKSREFNPLNPISGLDHW